MSIIYSKTYINNKQLSNIFIPTNQNWVSTEDEDLTIQESGEKLVLFNKIINLIKDAKEIICLQSFLIQDTQIIDELVRANEERNIKVYVLDSAETRLNNLRIEEEEHFSTTEYKTMLNEKFSGNIVHRQAENLHSKFIVIDPKTSPKGYLFTGNFNLKPFNENPELAVELNAQQVLEFYKLFVYHFWEYTYDEQTSSTTFKKVKPTGKFNPPNLEQVLITSPNSKLSNLKDTLINSVKSAQQHIIFSTFGFDITHELSQEILKKMEQGVVVTVFCRLREKAIQGNIEELSKKGAHVFCHPLIHAKSLLIDNKEAYIFTANFEYHGMDSGFETGVKLNHKQTKDLLYIYSKWEKTFPFKYFSQKNIQKISCFKTFTSNKSIQIKTQVEDNKVINSETVQHLLESLKNLRKPKHSFEKQIIINYTINTQKKPENYNVIADSEQFLEIDFKGKKKNKKIMKGIVIKNSILENNLLNKLEKNYKNHYLFSE